MTYSINVGCIVAVIVAILGGCDKPKITVERTLSDGSVVTREASFPLWAKELLQRAESGDAEAQYQIGERWRTENFDQYIKGAIPIGEPYFNFPDFEKAVKWLLKAANSNHAKAQTTLGVMYQYGQGLEQDGRKAIEWYEKAASQKHVEAFRHLGDLYYDGGVGVPKSVATAVKWYSLASNSYDELATIKLLFMYIEGNEIKSDPKLALQLLNNIAAQGFPSSQELLGRVYAGDYEKFQVQPDKVLAYAWLNVAASLDKKANEIGGNSISERRETIRRQMSVSELEEAERISSKWKKGKVIVREFLSIEK